MTTRSLGKAGAHPDVGMRADACANHSEDELPANLFDPCARLVLEFRRGAQPFSGASRLGLFFASFSRLAENLINSLMPM